MKKSIFTLVFLLAGLSSWAQMKEGSVSYKMEFSSDDPEMAMAIAMMTGSTMDMYFKEGATRVDVTMGSMMNMVTLTDTNQQEFLMLMDISMMGMKYAVKSTMEELKAQAGDDEEPKMDISLEKGKKEILGYKCKKAVATDADGNESVFWYTEDISVNKKGQSYLNEEVPGFPLEYQINQGGMIVSMTATQVESKLDKKQAKELFSFDIPEGYEEKTMEDLQQMGMGQ